MSRSQIELLAVDIVAARKRLVTALRRIESDQSMSKKTRASLSRHVKEGLKRLDTVRDLIHSMPTSARTRGNDESARPGRQDEQGRAKSRSDNVDAAERSPGSMPGGGDGWGDESSPGQDGGWGVDSPEGHGP